MPDNVTGVYDLTDLVNVTDDLTNETVFELDKILYYDLDQFDESGTQEAEGQ